MYLQNPTTSYTTIILGSSIAYMHSLSDWHISLVSAGFASPLR